jgi:hypothetical protein
VVMSKITFKKLRQKNRTLYETELSSVLGAELMQRTRLLVDNHEPKHLKGLYGQVKDFIKELNMEEYDPFLSSRNKPAVIGPVEPDGLVEKLIAIARDGETSSRRNAALSLATIVIRCRTDKKLLEAARAK